jgi:uncharacterized protein
MPFDTNFFWVYRDHQGEYRWTLFARNEKKLADSGEGFNTRQGCEENIALVKRVVPAAPIRYHESAARR